MSKHHNDHPMFSKLGKQLRTEEFDLDEDVVFCNSGSWACVPRRFIDRQHELIREREKNPQLWAVVKEPRLIWESLTALAEFIGAEVQNLTFVANTTEGSNIALKSQRYQSGDKILLCHIHGYHAVQNQARVLVEENEGVELVELEIPFPIRGKADILSAYEEALEQHPGIKITVINHISADTAIVFPLKEITQLCRQRGIITVVDGAHALGQIELTVEAYGADYYVGNLHKWLMLPQNAGFLWVNPKYQPITRPLATSHHCFNEHFRDRFYPPITRDRIIQCMVKDALEFLGELGGLERVTARNSELVTKAAAMLSEVWNTDRLEVSEDCRAPQMAIVAYPDDVNVAYADCGISDLEYDLQGVGVCGKVCEFAGKFWCRLSAQVWNDLEDFELLSERVKSVVKFKKARPSTQNRPTYFIPEAGYNSSKPAVSPDILGNC